VVAATPRFPHELVFSFAGRGATLIAAVVFRFGVRSRRRSPEDHDVRNIHGHVDWAIGIERAPCALTNVAQLRSASTASPPRWSVVVSCEVLDFL
jgi:hypothetical protein